MHKGRVCAFFIAAVAGASCVSEDVHEPTSAHGLVPSPEVEPGPKTEPGPDTPPSPAAVVRPEPVDPWMYRDEPDPMTGEARRSAATRSKNHHVLAFPFMGDVYATLMLRDHPRMGKDVIVMIDEGIVVCHAFMRCRITVRFDEDRPVDFRGVESSSGNSEVVFLEPSARFIAAAKKARRVRVELEVYNAGNRVFEFDVTGLRGW